VIPPFFFPSLEHYSLSSLTKISAATTIWAAEWLCFSLSMGMSTFGFASPRRLSEFDAVFVQILSLFVLLCRLLLPFIQNDFSVLHHRVRLSMGFFGLQVPLNPSRMDVICSV